VNTYRAIRPEKLPDPSAFNSEALLRELDRIRGLVLEIPVHNDNVLQVNTVIDSIWRLSEQLRYLLRLQADGQWQFAKKAAEQAQANTFAADKKPLKKAIAG
jgi:hypothetical protein